MKRSLLIATILTATTCSWAQNQCGSSNALFSFSNTSSPKEISKLGTAPEFPFLRNMATPAQLVAAMKRNDDKNTPGVEHLNDLLKSIGFENGVKDIQASNVTTYYVPSGTEGNMGSANYTMAYSKLVGDASEFKAWKISSNTGCNMYIMAKCGNAFYPNDKKTAACFSVPVSITQDTKDVTLTASGQKITSTNNTYVYYSRKRHKRHEAAYAVAGVPAKYPSKPLLLNTSQKVDVVPETYKVAVNAASNSATVCPDSTLNVAANISLEKTSSYAGYYPAGPKNEYKAVSKRAYKRSARKMHRIERKEAKVAKLTGVPVRKTCSI